MGFITILSVWLIPLFIMLVLIVATWKRIPSYELFVEGGKEGVKMAFTLLPFLVGMIVSISILRSSGALEAFINLLSPILTFFGVPPEIIPLALFLYLPFQLSLLLLSYIQNMVQGVALHKDSLQQLFDHSLPHSSYHSHYR